MGNKSIIHDARGSVDITLVCRPNQGVNFSFKLDPVNDGEVIELDTDYELKLGTKTYTVGSGLTLVNDNTIVWTKPSADFAEPGETASGYLKSNSEIAPKSIYWTINISVK